MLTVQLTPRLAGVSISGDAADLRQLEDALRFLTGCDPGEGSPYEMPAGAILSLCDELCRAWQGRCQIIFADNGLTGEMRQARQVLAPQRNVYFETRVRLPDMLFDLMALNDFFELAGRRAKMNDLNPAIQLVHFFQAAVTASFSEVLDDQAFSRFIGLIYGTVPRYRGFCTQYVALLASRYMSLAADERRRQILPLAHRLSKLGEDYHRLVADLEESALKLNCRIADLEPAEALPLPADGEW